MIHANKIDTKHFDHPTYERYAYIQKIQDEIFEKAEELKNTTFYPTRVRLNIELDELQHLYSTTNM